VHEELLSCLEILLEILSSEVLKSTGICQTSSSIDLGSIKATQAAINFYKQQARAKQIFDAIENENKEFGESIRVLKSYPNKYTDDLELPTSIWGDKCKENPFLLKDCIHGTNCQRINNCSCTPDSPKRQLNRHRKKEVARY
jgi:hypothetical protein